MKTWIKLDRFFAWILFIAMIIFFLTGWGMTKGIVDSKLSVTLHNDILPLIILISFVFHAGYATRLAFIRWQFWNLFIKIIWFLVFTCILFGFVYVDFFYKKPASNISQTQITKTTVSTPTSTISAQKTTQSTENSQERTFTIEELAQYNGQNGNPPFVAVDGIVYDMSDIFDNGTHYKHVAGQELTDEFYTTHIESEITKYPKVGILEK